MSALDLAGHRRGLVRLLQLAYSGEKAAALAYAGHWRSLPQGTARDTIVRIEKEEVEHRQTVGTMLNKLGEKPAFWREVLMGTIGRL
ncbi:MAG TPA: ferritin-like domain-containing protein, partial [Candidatus Obscuribacter sp.]|nr:ferritin-like domain-containing protein [Candidatus Obscuribacter sp.]